MKIKILLILILVLVGSIDLSAQRVTSKKSIKEVGFKNDEDFNVTTFPDKWKDESAIILCQKYDFSYVKFGLNSINYREIFRKRVLINDLKAKEKYSIYYFIERDESKGNIGFFVEKADGSIIDVDLNDAVSVAANEVSSVYRSYYSYNDDYKKIAIPNLEVGDIIDYYVYGVTTHKSNKSWSYPKFSFSLASTYPILKQKFYFNVDRGFKVNFRAFNGAPEIVQGKAGVNKYGKSKERIKTYIIEDENRDKLKSEIWKYNTLTEPWIKFQVYFQHANTLGGMPGITYQDKDLVNFPVEKEKIKEEAYVSQALTSYNYEVTKYVKRHSKNLTNEEKAEFAYYYYRYSTIKSLKTYYFDYPGGEFVSVKYSSFISNFGAILKELDIPFKYIIAVDRGVGNFDNVIFIDDVTSCINVGDKYYFYFSNVSTSDMIPSFVQGSNTIEFYTDKKRKKEKFTESKIPAVTYDNNAIFSRMKVQLDESMDTCIIVNIDSLVGSKKGIYNDIVLTKTDYLENDLLYFNNLKEKARSNNKGVQTKKKSNKKTVKKSKSGLRKEAEEKRVKEQEKKELIKLRSDFFIDLYESDYEINCVDSVRIINSGRLPNNPSCVVKQVYKVDELINKAGRNYILNIGALIGWQLELDEEDMTRNIDIDISQQASYNFDIEVVIPEGYYVESVDALNFNVVNEMGEFTATATIEGNIIKIVTSKKYKTTHAPKENWNDYVAFIEAAFEFSQKKVIIKKNI